MSQQNPSVEKQRSNSRPSSVQNGRATDRLQFAVKITLKEGVRDPQGRAIQELLARMGYDKIADVRQGKHIKISFHDADPESAREAVNAMCRDFLANPVIEDYRVSIDDA